MGGASASGGGGLKAAEKNEGCARNFEGKTTLFVRAISGLKFKGPVTTRVKTEACYGYRGTDGLINWMASMGTTMELVMKMIGDISGDKVVNKVHDSFAMVGTAKATTAAA